MLTEEPVWQRGINLHGQVMAVFNRWIVMSMLGHCSVQLRSIEYILLEVPVCDMAFCSIMMRDGGDVSYHAGALCCITFPQLYCVHEGGVHSDTNDLDQCGQQHRH